MRTLMLFYMLLGISFYFPRPLTGNEYGADCACVDGTSCGGSYSCSCSTGTCIADSLPGEPPEFGDEEHCEDPKHGFWCHCGPCPDGSTCQGKISCHCDEKTGACEAFNVDRNTTTTTDVPAPVTTTTDVPDPVTTTTDFPDPVTATTDHPDPVTTATDNPEPITTAEKDSCEGCEDCCVWPPPSTSFCQDCWTHSCCNSTTTV